MWEYCIAVIIPGMGQPQSGTHLGLQFCSESWCMCVCVRPQGINNNSHEYA